jgi:hypothetical protein
VIGGARYTDQEITTDIDITAPPPTAQTQQKLEAGDDWWHAFGGVRVTHAFTDRWNFTARGDLGYGGSDNSAANLGFMFRYRFRDWGSAFIGARYLRYDYDNDSSSNGYAYDAAQTGPMAGITIHW